MGKLIQNIGLVTLAASALLLSGCGGDSDPMKAKKYIIIETSVPEGICESAALASGLTDIGLQNFITRETDGSTTCATYGKANDGQECAMTYVGGGTKNCVIGFDGVAGYSRQTTPAELYDTMEAISASFK